MNRVIVKDLVIDCISDLHGYYPKLEGGDLLIVAGDLTANDQPNDRLEFLQWLADQTYRKKIWVAGNHDNSLVGSSFRKTREDAAEYLCDSGTEFEGLKICGSPWTKTFPGMNPKCKAFTVDTDEELAEKWALIPENIDILITHSPPLGFGDMIDNSYNFGSGSLHVGSESLHHLLYSGKIRPRLHVFGHIHEGYGHIKYVDDVPHTQFVNASHVNKNYQPVNKPIRVIL